MSFVAKSIRTLKNPAPRRNSSCYRLCTAVLCKSKPLALFAVHACDAALLLSLAVGLLAHCPSTRFERRVVRQGTQHQWLSNEQQAFHRRIITTSSQPLLFSLQSIFHSRERATLVVATAEPLACQTPQVDDMLWGRVHVSRTFFFMCSTRCPPSLPQPAETWKEIRSKSCRKTLSSAWKSSNGCKCKPIPCPRGRQPEHAQTLSDCPRSSSIINRTVYFGVSIGGMTRSPSTYSI